MANQIVIPKSIFVGERVQLQYVFEDAFLAEGNTKDFNLETASEIFAPYSDFLTIEDASLTHNGTSHTLSLTFFVWEEGKIEFEPFSIEPAVIALEPIEVKSIVAETGAESLRPILSPILIPGTTWLVYLASAAAIVFFIGAAVVLRKFDAVNSAARRIFSRLFFRRNARKTLKLLGKLGGFQGSDKDFCERLQRLMRNYVSKRFNDEFRAVATRDIPLFFEGILGETPSVAEDLAAVFERLEFVRFGAGGSWGEVVRQAHQPTVPELVEGAVVRQAHQPTAHQPVGRDELILTCRGIVEGFESDTI